MNIYTINSLSVLGDKDETYGFTYWGYVHESDYPVRFSSHQVIDDIKDKGRKLVAESQETRQGKKGEYLQLKKVKLDTDQPTLKEQWDETVDKAEVNVPTPAPEVPKTTVTRTTFASTPPKHVSTAYLKDLSDYPVRIFTGSLHYAKDIGLNLMDNDDDMLKYFEYVKKATDELLTYSDNIRGANG